MGKMIATVLSMLMLAVAAMAMALLMLPILQKVKLEQTIRDYNYEANQVNGFSIDQREALQAELGRLGLFDIEIKVPMRGELERFESQQFSVAGKINVKRFGTWLYLYEEPLPFTYKGRIFGKRIIN